MGNTFGSVFRVTTFGESHGPMVGAVIDGLPAQFHLKESDIQPQLDRRRPGQSDLTTPRQETDTVQIISGLQKGVTLGSPVTLVIPNRDTKPEDYGEMRAAPRPSHADFTYMTKYGVLASSGGGRASARETVARVAAGAVAEKLLRERYGIEIVAWVQSVGELESAPVDVATISRELVDKNPVRCPDQVQAAAMATLIRSLKEAGDSVGGVVSCVCRNVPAGWGEPVFGKLSGLLAGAMLTIPATRGFEFGLGFAATSLRGSAHNDPFVKRGKSLGTLTNNSGGIQGGISNGESIVFRVAFKPPATIGCAQATVDWAGHACELKARGRHDPCVVPRAVPVVEAMAAMVLADAALMAAAAK
ncbi:MAG: chorismate synthase [bacterium]